MSGASMDLKNRIATSIDLSDGRHLASLCVQCGIVDASVVLSSLFHLKIC